MSNFLLSQYVIHVKNFNKIVYILLFLLMLAPDLETHRM